MHGGSRSSESILRNGTRCMAQETERRCRNAASSQKTTHEHTIPYSVHNGVVLVAGVL